MFVMNRPRIMEDELLFSYIRRIAAANSISIHRFLKTYVYKNPLNNKYYDFSYGMNNYIVKFAESINYDPQELFIKTTLYPVISLVASKEYQTHVVNEAFRGCDVYPRIITPLKSEITELHLCPECRDVEMIKYGYFWYHRAHNIPGVKMCHRHKRGLLKYTGKIGREHNVSDEYIPSEYEPVVYKNEELEYLYSLFTFNLLNSGLDQNSDELSSIWKSYVTKDDTIRERFEYCKENGFFEDDYSWAEWLKLLSTSSRCGWENILKGHFLVDPFNEIYKSMGDPDPRDFIKKMPDNYSLVSRYRHSIITVQKDNELPFVTTPYGFQIGWRSPYSDDTKDEQEKYRELVKLTRNDEYIPVSEFNGMNKKISLSHTKCKKIYTVRAKNFLEHTSSCPCMHRLDHEKIKEELSTNQFEVLNITEDSNRELRVRCRKCNEVFAVGYRPWKEKQYCRRCEKPIPFKGCHLKGCHPVKEVDFPNLIRQLTGEEYEMIGTYESMTKDVEILHKKCMETIRMSPYRFIRGERCSCQLPIRGKGFIDFVEKTTSGEYTVERDGFSYRIRNRISGEERIMKKPMILQELMRPTPSEILPVKKKNNNYDPHYIHPEDALLMYLKNNCEAGYIVTAQLQVPELTDSQMRKVLEKCRENPLSYLKYMTKGKYQYLGDCYG